MTKDTQLQILSSKRADALRAGNADEWHRFDDAIQALIAEMRAEVRLGLRDDPCFSVPA